MSKVKVNVWSGRPRPLPLTFDSVLPGVESICDTDTTKM